jgi:hypothetical protein
MVFYHHHHHQHPQQVVEPKRAKLREAESALADANRKLEEKQAVLKEVSESGSTREEYQGLAPQERYLRVGMSGFYMAGWHLISQSFLRVAHQGTNLREARTKGGT